MYLGNRLYYLRRILIRWTCTTESLSKWHVSASVSRAGRPVRASSLPLLAAVSARRREHVEPPRWNARRPSSVREHLRQSAALRNRASYYDAVDNRHHVPYNVTAALWRRCSDIFTGKTISKSEYVPGAKYSRAVSFSFKTVSRHDS